MARTKIFGWDTGSLASEAAYVFGGDGVTVSQGSVAQETSIIHAPRGGSLKVTPASGAAGYWLGYSGLGGFGTSHRLRVYVRITSLPATARRLMSGGGITLTLNPNGTLTLTSQVGATTGTSTSSLTDSTRWYKIDFGKPTTTTCELRIDDVSEVSQAANLGETVSARFGSDDTVAATYTAYFDDAVVDDAVWPEPGYVGLLVPVSDSQIGSWTGGSGGVSNLWDAVDNTPPSGTASESNTTQIESIDGSGDNGTDEYRANMATYASIGILPWDTINSVQVLIWSGEDVATGAKTGSVALIANPAPASYEAFTYGPSGSGALGTFPSNWVSSGCGISQSPAVTLTTNPQVAIRKTDSGTRVASICFIGLKVDYTPGPPMDRPQVNHYPQLLAH